MASAQQPLTQEPAPITVSTNSLLQLFVDGLETQQLPGSVQPGSRVCIDKALHYVSVSERWVFEAWSHGPTTACVTLTGAARPGSTR